MEEGHVLKLARGTVIVVDRGHDFTDGRLDCRPVLPLRRHNTRCQKEVCNWQGSQDYECCHTKIP